VDATTAAMTVSCAYVAWSDCARAAAVALRYFPKKSNSYDSASNRWRERRFWGDERTLAVSLAVLALNTALTFGYKFAAVMVSCA